MKIQQIHPYKESPHWNQILFITFLLKYHIFLLLIQGFPGVSSFSLLLPISRNNKLNG